jgi:multidrug efflux system membrane fusion protein
MSYVKIARFSILPALLAAAVLAGCSRSQATAGPGATPPPPTVSVAEVLSKPLRDFEEFTGRLEPVTTVSIQPRVAGFVDSAQFAEGAHVKKGQLLFRIDARPFQAEVDRLAAQAKRARTQSVLAATNRDRGNQLIAKHVIAQQDYDVLEATANSSKDDIGAAEAALEAARLNLEFTQVRSPIDGRVSRMLITPGNLVGITSVLTTVVSDDPVYAYFDADEQTYLRFAHHDTGSASPVYMGLVDEQGYPHEGRLDFVDNQVDARSGTIHARAVFANKDGRYTPGLFARIKLVGGDTRDTVLIDERAVGTDLGKKFVLAEEGQHARVPPCHPRREHRWPARRQPGSRRRRRHRRQRIAARAPGSNRDAGARDDGSERRGRATGAGRTSGQKVASTAAGTDRATLN